MTKWPTSAPGRFEVGFLLCALAMVSVACMTDSQAGEGVTRGTGGAAAAGTGGGSGGGTSCAMGASGCFCQQGTDPGLATCSATSVVKNSGELGGCCDDGAGNCNCDAFICKTIASGGLCECAARYTVDLDVLSGTTSAECAAPTGNQKCCLSTESGRCTCSGASCDSVDSAVDTCTASRVAMICPADRHSVPSCK